MKEKQIVSPMVVLWCCGAVILVVLVEIDIWVA
jgi:hypothetical protein